VKHTAGGAPIQAFVGLNNSGKTLGAMALAVLPVLEAGGDALTTCHIDHPRARPFTQWRELVWMEKERQARRNAGEELASLVVFLDEITSALPARQAMSLPPQLARLFNQLRKVNVQLVWTAPNWARADKLLREVTGTVTVCRGMFPDRYKRGPDGKAKLRDEAGHAVRAPRAWAPNRVFRFRTYSAEDYEEFTLARAAKLRPVSKTFYVRKAHAAHLLYDTFEAVELLDHVDDAGLCVACGLPRPRGKCVCSPDERAAAEAPPGAQPLTGATGVTESVEDVETDFIRTEEELDRIAWTFGAGERSFWDQRGARDDVAGGSAVAGVHFDC
jgi:hypothetical protein